MGSSGVCSGRVVRGTRGSPRSSAHAISNRSTSGDGATPGTRSSVGTAAFSRVPSAAPHRPRQLPPDTDTTTDKYVHFRPWGCAVARCDAVLGADGEGHWTRCLPGLSAEAGMVAG